MNLRFPESKIPYWADRYVEHANEKNIEIEKGLMDLKCVVQQRGYLTKEELYRVAHWKSPRRSGLVLENSEESVKNITARAFASDNDNEKYIELTNLKGIGVPIASAILHFYDKGMYPIVDIHALWSCGLEWTPRISYPFWEEYIHFCRGLAERNDVDMRTVDRALWRFSYDHPNKEITWEDIREKLEDLKGGQRFSPELKAYLLIVTDKLCSLGMSLEECAYILGMWGGTLSSWMDSDEE